MSSTATATLVQTSIDQRTIKVWGTIAVTAGTYTAGGLTLDLSKLIISPAVPLEVKIYSQAQPLASPPTSVSGYIYSYGLGTTQANGTLQILDVSTSVLAEISGSTPTAVVNDTIGFHAVFVR